MMHDHRSQQGIAAKALGVVAAASLVLTACSGPDNSGSAADGGGDEVVTIQTVTMSVTGTHWREMVATEKGFFEDEGLIVQETVANPQISVDAVISGDAQIGFSDTQRAIQATEAGADLLIVASGLDKVNYSFVAGQDIESVEDLRGQTIAAAGDVDVFTQVIFEILENGGVDPSEVNFTYGQGSNDRAAALQGGAIQAALIPPPANHRLESAGFNILTQTADLLPLFSLSATVVRADWATENGDTIRKYIRAIATATDWLYDPANKDEAIAILTDATGASVEDAESAYRDYIDTQSFNVGACVQRDAVQVLLDRTNELGVVESSDPDDFITTEYCD